MWAGFQRVQPALHKGVRPRHTREDEYSYVLAGQVGALLGDEVLIARPGDLVFKPRNQWHTFWNAGDEPARILEIIAPAGFEKFFAELVDLGGVSNTSPALFADLCGRYGLDMDPSSVPGLVERFGVRFPGGTALEKALREAAESAGLLSPQSDVNASRLPSGLKRATRAPPDPQRPSVCQPHACFARTTHDR